MSFGNTFVKLALGLTVATVPAFSQEDVSYKSDAAVQVLGSFVKGTTDKGIEQKATNSGGVLASYRFYFDRHNGVEVNYGYALNTQSFGLPAGPLGVKTYSHEASADYILRFPSKRLTPFVLAGAGGLVFDPKNLTAAGTQGRAAFVYGGGADFNLSSHIFVRAEYRGLVYNTPTYDLPGLAGAARVTHRAEPSVGFGYRF